MVSSRTIGWTNGSGRHAPARLALTALLLALGPSAAAQQRVAPAVPVIAAPDATTVLKLVWSVMAAVDHANQTGNYSVLRDLGAPSFQGNNNAATLAGVFGAIRAQRVDLSNALIVTPNYDFAPSIIDGGLLRVRGNFPFRPNPIGFDLLFQNVSGSWRLFGIAVAPLSVQRPQAAPARR